MAKGDYEFSSPAHHGTPEERVGAFKAGYRFHTGVEQSPQAAYLGGVEYIKALAGR
jgi:hypothetical protein